MNTIITQIQMTNLTSEYFTILATTQRDDIEYCAYQCHHESLILYSADGEPLSVVSFKCANDSNACAVLAPRRDKTGVDFQGIVTKDNQEIQFVITNLSLLGMIKVDIMKNNTAVHDVDPGAEKGGVNRVNELHPRQSSLIRTDQSTSCIMILSTITNNQGAKLTVGEAETITPHQPDGTYFYFAVTPQLDVSNLVTKFQDTHWVKDNIFVLKSHVHRFAYDCAESAHIGSRIVCDGPARSFCGPVIPRGISSESISVDCAPNEDKIIDAQQIDDDVIKQSYACNLKQGQFLFERSRYTGINYEYNVSSNQTGHLCCLSLSVHFGPQFIPSLTTQELAMRGQELITTYISAQQATYLDQLKKVFTQDECSICLEKNIDTVFYDCGHACCHKVCVGTQTKCPLCRRHIVAILNTL
jgi:hypothetical protein